MGRSLGMGVSPVSSIEVNSIISDLIQSSHRKIRRTEWAILI